MTCPGYACTEAKTEQVTFYKIPEQHGHVYLVAMYYLEPIRDPFPGEGLLPDTGDHLGDVDERTLEHNTLNNTRPDIIMCTESIEVYNFFFLFFSFGQIGILAVHYVQLYPIVSDQCCRSRLFCTGSGIGAGRKY